MSFLLRDFFKDFTSSALTVTGISADTRTLEPGNLFFALNGPQHVDAAISKGAVAVVAQEKIDLASIECIVVPNVRAKLLDCLQKMYKTDQLDLIGITGTCGKTTTTMLVQWLLKAFSTPVGLVGGVHCDVGGDLIPSVLTTPDVVTLHKLLSECQQRGVKHCVMEASSHGIDQGRIDGLHFSVVAFTNLSHEHLDYHLTMEDYFLAKQKLFKRSSCAVVLGDDAYGMRLIREMDPSVKLIRVGSDPSFEVSLESFNLIEKGSTLTVRTSEGRFSFETNLLGRYNIDNVLVALGILIAQNLPIVYVRERLASFPGAPGRMQPVYANQPFSVYVDHAHKEEALRKTLAMLRSTSAPYAKIHVVFGCGGDRDRSKRSGMVAAVQSYADYAWATADNPRTEPLDQIFSDMKTGILDPERIKFIEDRGQAIQAALNAAEPGDVILLAGKGHETYQEFAHGKVPFNDAKVAADLLFSDAKRGENFI
jgi:UDP-N-acetylmuramoyl-L-alanyl-D-glutamate--2,6-diaminopimelate ligase